MKSDGPTPGKAEGLRITSLHSLQGGDELESQGGLPTQTVAAPQYPPSPLLKQVMQVACLGKP